jgi:cobalt-zinc-cadmium efflux system protein
MTHNHGSHAERARGRTQSLTWTLALVVGYTAAEVIGGLWSGSLALLADAGHMLSDAAALGLTLLAMRFAQRTPTPERTYGFHRAEILAALANGATLVAIAIFIFFEAYARFRNPPEVQGGLMFAVAVGGLGVNLIGLWLLRGNHAHDLNVRGAWFHVLTDALGSMQAIAAGALIWAFGWFWVDPLASVLIGLLVIYSSWSLIRQSVSVLMEGTPCHITMDAVDRAPKEVETVGDVHDLHIWSITSGFVITHTNFHTDIIER